MLNRRRTLLSFGLLALLAAPLAAGCTSTKPATGASSAPPASATPSASAQDDAAVQATWGGFVATFTKMLNTAAPVANWDQYAALTAATNGTNEMFTFRQEGIVVPGAPIVTEARITSLQQDANPPTAAMTACWNASNFQPVFATSSASAGTGAAAPALVNVGLQRFSQYVTASDSGWRVVTFTVTNTPCTG